MVGCLERSRDTQRQGGFMDLNWVCTIKLFMEDCLVQSRDGAERRGIKELGWVGSGSYF